MRRDYTKGLPDYTLYEVAQILLEKDKGVGADDRFSEFKAFIKPYAFTTGFEFWGTRIFSSPLINPLHLGIFNVNRLPGIDQSVRQVVLDYFSSLHLGDLLINPFGEKNFHTVYEGFVSYQMVPGVHPDRLIHTIKALSISSESSELNNQVGSGDIEYIWAQKYFAYIKVVNDVDKFKFYLHPTKHFIKDETIRKWKEQTGFNLNIQKDPFEVYTDYEFSRFTRCHDMQGRVHTVDSV